MEVRRGGIGLISRALRAATLEGVYKYVGLFRVPVKGRGGQDEEEKQAVGYQRVEERTSCNRIETARAASRALELALL